MYHLRSTARAERELAAQSTVTMPAGHPNLSSENPIHIYIDHSNLTIGGQRAYRSSGMENGGPWNYEVLALRRIIMQKLDFIETPNPNSVRLNIYGADLPDNEQIDPLCQHGEVGSICECPRNGSGKEKQADTQLTADMVTEVIYTHFFLRDNYSQTFLQNNHDQSFPDQCVFVVISGGSDMIPAVRSAVEHGFHVHVWAWSRSLSSLFEVAKNRLAYPGRVRIHYLEDHLEELTQQTPHN